MSKILEPYNLQYYINKNNKYTCKCCNSLLYVKNKKNKLNINKNCNYCKLPFTIGDKTYYPKKCVCNNLNKDYKHIYCPTCINPKCIGCNRKIDCTLNNCEQSYCIICRYKKDFKSKL